MDLEAGRASVAQTIIEGKGGPRLSTPKAVADACSRSTLKTVRALREHRKEQLAERMLAGSAWLDVDLVFCDGSPIWPLTFSRAFHRHAADAGLPAIRLHDLRHSWATIALGAGVHPKLVHERLGHAAISITLDTYNHALPTMHEDAAATVAALLTATGGSR